MEPHENVRNPHTFWLFDWGVIEVYTGTRWRPLYVLCQLDQDGLRIEIPEHLIHLSLNEIVNCEQYVFSQGPRSGSAVNIKLTLLPNITMRKGRLTNNELFLVTAHVFRYQPSFDECEEMISVLNQYRVGLTPTVSKNPYEREFHRQGRQEQFDPQKWNAQLSPVVFLPPYRPIRSILTFLLIVVGATIVVMALFGLIFNLLN